MNSLLIYLLQSGLILGALYLIYWLFLRRDTFFGINRVYLISSVFVSLVFPLMKFSFTKGGEQTYMVFLEPIIITQDSLRESMMSNFSTTQILLSIYIIGAAFFLFRFLYRLIQIGVLIRQNGISKRFGLKVVYVPHGFTPFSFFNILFISREISDKTQLEKIVAHERIHIQQKHSADLILMEIISILQWFNPFIWLFRNSVKNIHEFQADHGVIETGYDKRDYQKLLLNQTFGVQINTLSNNFNHSLIKTRFKMMTKTKTKKAALLKMVIVVPAALILTLIFSISVTDRVIAQTDSEAKKVEKAQEPVTKSQKDEEIFTVVEEMPSFPGGKDAMFKFISTNIKYPESARKNGVHGRVFISYVVEKDGKINDVEIIRGFDKECDAEALRVVKMMPNWNPGKEKGKAVRTKFNLPIAFMLDGKGEKESKTGEVKDPPPPPKSEKK